MNAKSLSTPAAAPVTTAPRSRLRLSLDRFGLPLVFILLCLVMAFASEYFMTWRNWMDILRQTSINGILAVGMTYVILTKGIDLSVGSILAFAGLCSAMVATQGYGLLAAVSAGMFGPQFAFRLAAAEANAAGGSLTFIGQKLVLTMPVLTASGNTHSRSADAVGG